MNNSEIGTALVYAFINSILGLLSAALAKRLKVSPLLGFIAGFFCPGISLGIILFIARYKRTI